jgi:TPR repeat protein
VSAELRFTQDQAGWVALEFLAWWVRDLSRSGECIQMRPLALPPVAYGTQLGRTLNCVIELFLVTPEGNRAPILDKLARLADSLEGNLRDYANAIAHPTQAELKDMASLQRAAENDDASAQFRLALCYANGKGVEKSAPLACKWFSQAANWGHPDAMLQLGIRYEHGDGVARDSGTAFTWFLKSAEAGVPLGMGCVGGAYQTGKGVSKDLAKAVEWFRRGADLDNAVCQAELGECYELGKGVGANLAEALRWYQAALENGLEAVQPAIDRVKQALR